MKYLTIKWSISRAQDSFGYNVVTLIDGDKKYRTLGGGYDMLGTVFAKWLQDNYLEEIKSKLQPCVYEKDEHGFNTCNHSDYYGFFCWKETGKYYLDGACGLDCIVKIAKAIGLTLSTDYDRKKCTTRGFMVNDNRINKDI